MHSFSSRSNSRDIARSRSSCFNSREIAKTLKGREIIKKKKKTRFDFTEMNFRYARQRGAVTLLLYVGVQLKEKRYCTDLQSNGGVIPEELGRKG